MGRMTATVHDSAQAPVYARLQEGSDAPDFTLPAIVPGTAENGLINLSDVLEDGRRVVLYFYPAAMTPGCTTEACDFRDNLARLESQNVAVLGVSKDSLEKLRKFAEHDHLTFPLLSDPDLTVHKLYGAYGEKEALRQDTRRRDPFDARHQSRRLRGYRSLQRTCQRPCRFAIKGTGKVGEAGEVVRSRCSDTVVRAVCAV